MSPGPLPQPAGDGRLRSGSWNLVPSPEPDGRPFFIKKNIAPNGRHRPKGDSTASIRECRFSAKILSTALPIPARRGRPVILRRAAAWAPTASPTGGFEGRRHRRRRGWAAANRRSFTGRLRRTTADNAMSIPNLLSKTGTPRRVRWIPGAAFRSVNRRSKRPICGRSFSAAGRPGPGSRSGGSARPDAGRWPR